MKNQKNRCGRLAIGFFACALLVGCNSSDVSRNVDDYSEFLNSLPEKLVSHFPDKSLVDENCSLYYSKPGFRNSVVFQVEVPMKKSEDFESIVEEYSRLLKGQVKHGTDESKPDSFLEGVVSPRILTGRKGFSLPDVNDAVISEKIVNENKPPFNRGVVVRRDERTILYWCIGGRQN